MKKKLAIVSTHPIQYNAPWFKLLSGKNNIQLKVFYTWSQAESGLKYDPGFKKNIEWNIPLLDDYEYQFVQNTSKRPGTKSYKGIVNPQIIKCIEQWQPNAILVFGWNFKSHLKCLRYFHNKVPILFRGDSTLLDERQGIKKILRQLILKWVYQNVDYALYVGTENKNYFLHYGLKEKQLIFAPHAIDNKRFAPCESMKTFIKELKYRSGIDENDFVFLFAGKLEPKKNVQLLIEAFNRNNFQKCKLVITGNGVSETELKKKCANKKNIIFMDFQNQQQMPVVYQLADVFVLPSKGPGETWGLSVNEAMASMKPVLVSDRCGCAADLVEEGKNGYIFRSGNLEDLAQKMRIFYERKNDIKKMGEFSFEKIKDWSFEKIALQVEQTVLALH